MMLAPSQPTGLVWCPRIGSVAMLQAQEPVPGLRGLDDSDRATTTAASTRGRVAQSAVDLPSGQPRSGGHFLRPG
jgi:hypothetical protein